MFVLASFVVKYQNKLQASVVKHFINENIPRDIIPCCEWRPKDDKPFYRDGNIVYSKVRCLNEVFETEKEPYVLVTEEGDLTIFQYEKDFYNIRWINGYPHGYIKKIPDTVIKWFGTNLNFRHEKTELLPFGTLTRHSDTIKQEPLKNPEDKGLIYANFDPNSSYKREHIIKATKGCEWLNIQFPPAGQSKDVYHRHFLNYIYMTSMHKFILCPEGNGIDTFRIWEALSLGCIPIVERSYFSSYLNDLPVYIVDDILDLTYSGLNRVYDEIMSKEYNLEKLTKKYWIDKIKSCI